MRFIIGFLVFAVFALGARYWYFCSVKGLCGHEAAVVEHAQVPLKTPARAKTLSFWVGETEELSGREQFYFDYSSHEPVLSDDNKAFLGEVAEWLRANPGRTLTLLGMYYDQERQPETGYYENLGLARAAAVREILVNDYNAPAEALRLDHLFVITPAGVNRGPSESVSFKVLGETSQTGLSEARYDFMDMTFSDANFEKGSAKLRPGKQFVAYADSVRVFLEKNPRHSVLIVGHTDTDGDDKKNKQLGLERAQAGKRYFEGIGVKARVEVASEGENKPVAPNDNPENKSKNRRINIQLKPTD